MSAFLAENPTWSHDQALDAAKRTKRLLAALRRTWSNRQRRNAQMIARYLELNDAYRPFDSLSGEGGMSDEL